MPAMKLYAVVVSLSLSACMISDSVEELSVAESSLSRSECDPMGCGTNSPHVGNYSFTDLNMDGLENNQNFRIERFEKPGHLFPYRMSVVGGRISGRNQLGQVISGGGVMGMRIWLRHVPTNQQIIIKIGRMDEVHYWADNGSNVMADAYWLLWDWGNNGTTKGEWKNVCKDQPPTSIDAMGMDAMLAVVFEGERIDAAKKTIAPILEKRWFNIGCAGNALAKLHLTGHTQASRIAAHFETTVEQRQTMLKMLTADYCGSGKAFTVAGQELDWRDDKGTMPYFYAQQTVEALWTPNGARCLNTPRMIANPQYAMSWWTTLEIESEIEAECKLELCTEKALGYHLVSANPVLP
jgi:hypothetical protein